MNSEPTAFQELCKSHHERLRVFREEYPDLDVVFGAALDVGKLVVGSISLVSNLTITETHRWMMWQTVFEYQKQSLLLLTTGNTDAGLALLRLASELSRDVAVIRDDEIRLDLWMKRRGPTRQREYRRLFRFDDTAAGTKAHNTYEFCSEYGVHGHVSDAMHLERVGTFLPPNRDEFAVLTVSDSGVLSALQVWLAAFGSLHQLCLETFVPKHGEILSEPSRLFMQMIEAIGPILKAISTRLHQLAASRPN
jgi:hypothetical protein